ncbi:MAG: DNA polymerase III subunit chi [Rhodobacteraceae bacterium]|nr:DNA polymerase III subunit chi [Paracoccaceae bacterium]
MGAAYFYHLTRQPVEEALPLLLDRALAQGWRVAVRGQAARLDRLDRLLWTVPPNGFLPHGLAGGQHDARQPILLGGPVPEANDPACLMSLDGAEITPDEVRRSDRACILFDGHDPAALDRARSQWVALTGAGCAAQYWSQDSGRWEKKQERPERT